MFADVTDFIFVSIHSQCRDDPAEEYLLEFLSQCIVIVHLLVCLIKMIEFSEGKVWSSICALPASGKKYNM